MDDELKRYQSISLELCYRLLRDLSKNNADAERFFHGELYKAYAESTDKAIEHVQRIKNKVRKL